MKINNIDSQRLLSVPIFWTIISIVLTIALFWCFFINADSLTFSGFFKYYYLLLDTMSKDMGTDGYVAWFIPIGVVSVYILSIVFWVNISKATSDYNSKLNLKSIEFLPDRICLSFNKHKYNIVCTYDELSNLKLIIHTILVHTKNGTYVKKISDLEIVFTVLNNGEEFRLKNYSWLPMKIIYQIIDYTRGMKNFSYEFKGAGEIQDVKEKIEDYKRYGLKQILATNEENNAKFMSMILFVIGFGILISFLDILLDTKNDFWIVGLAPTVMIVLSFIPDIFLIMDKTRERKYGKHR